MLLAPVRRSDRDEDHCAAAARRSDRAQHQIQRIKSAAGASAPAAKGPLPYGTESAGFVS